MIRSPYNYENGFATWLISGDIIQMKTDIILKDRKGNIIEIYTPKPEYLIDSIL